MYSSDSFGNNHCAALLIIVIQVPDFADAVLIGEDLIKA